MDLYSTLFKKILFLFEPETAHKLALKALNLAHKFKLISLLTGASFINDSVQIAGLNFKNKLGIAAGLDKNGDYIAALASLGVGFIEIGTVTPLPQRGNPKPRLFRLKDYEAIINRMGFNNKGIDYLVNNVKKYRAKTDKQYQAIIGINIGKNFDTPLDKATEDYLACFEKAYNHADYICINISSPNTKNLRDLQQQDYLSKLLSALTQKQKDLSSEYNRKVPLALKIAPDLTDEQIKQISELCYHYQIDIIIATNTTIEDKLLYDIKGQKTAGGLSGKPLLQKSNHIISRLLFFNKELEGSGHNVSIIGVGGISSADDAQSKFTCGADLIQVYSGLIYQGPSLINNILINKK